MSWYPSVWKAHSTQDDSDVASRPSSGKLTCAFTGIQSGSASSTPAMPQLRSWVMTPFVSRGAMNL